MQTWVLEKGWSLSPTGDLQKWVLVEGDLSVNVQEVLGAAGAEGASIWMPGGSSSVFPMCCLLYHGKGAEDQQSLHTVAMNEDRINSCRSLLASNQ